MCVVTNVTFVRTYMRAGWMDNSVVWVLLLSAAAAAASQLSLVAAGRKFSPHYAKFIDSIHPSSRRRGEEEEEYTILLQQLVVGGCVCVVVVGEDVDSSAIM